MKDCNGRSRSSGKNRRTASALAHSTKAFEQRLLHDGIDRTGANATKGIDTIVSST
jgi:hypothetical protein